MIQHNQSSHYTPATVQKQENPGVPSESPNYTQYLHQVHTQINSCKDFHDLLIECARNVDSNMGTMPTVPVGVAAVKAALTSQ